MTNQLFNFSDEDSTFFKGYKFVPIMIPQDLNIDYESIKKSIVKNTLYCNFMNDLLCGIINTMIKSSVIYNMGDDTYEYIGGIFKSATSSDGWIWRGSEYTEANLPIRIDNFNYWTLKLLSDTVKPNVIGNKVVTNEDEDNNQEYIGIPKDLYDDAIIITTEIFIPLAINYVQSIK